MSTIDPGDRSLAADLPGLDLITDSDVLDSLSHDDAEWAPTGRPVGAIRARTTEEVTAIVAACAARRIPVVARGAGTGLSGGANAVDGGLILDLSRMNRIVEIDPDNMIAIVQPGVVNDDLKAAVAAHGLWYPPDPASAPWSTIGGNVATNAGGLCCLKYGVTRDYVLGLQAVVGGPAGPYGTAVRAQPPHHERRRRVRPGRALRRLGGHPRRRHRGHAAPAPRPHRGTPYGGRRL
nr:hypothetical protein GCM10020092_106900 [Actinoplanes digitatis]